MNDTGSRLAVLPPCLAVLFGASGQCPVMLVPPGLLGAPSPEVEDAHAVLCFAAGYVLSWWAADGARSLRLEGGRLWPELLPPQHVVGWSIDDADAAEVLVATVHLGATYKGWEKALRIARRGLSEPGRRAA